MNNQIPKNINGYKEVTEFKGEFAIKPNQRKHGKIVGSVEPKESKLLHSIEDAVKKSGLKDGMTISFHHHFRGGDYILNDVMDVIAKMGIKDLRICSSSLNAHHHPLIEHIKDGVVTSISTSGIRGELAVAISQGILKNPVVIRSHGGRARAIECGEEKIDVAFLGAASCDDYGNANGYGKATCGSLGYALMDAKFADTVIILTDNIVEYPNTPFSIPQNEVNFVVEVESIGDPSKIGGKETRYTKNPRDLLISQKAAEVITKSPYFKEGFSFQTGSGGASLAVSRFLREEMIRKDIKASFALGGITMPMVDMLKEGLIKKLFDVQSFDLYAAKSVFEHENHHEIDASYYASIFNQGCIANKLDIVVLSALEIDVDFNVNVITGSDGEIRGASGGHSDTAAASKMSIIVAPLVRGRIPSVVEKVHNIVTPGESIDVLVTDYGVAVNPKRKDLIEAFTKAKINILDINELKDKAYKITGKPKAIEYEDNIVGVVEYRDGSVIDVIKQKKK